jgi:hypothetical protein
MLVMIDVYGPDYFSRESWSHWGNTIRGASGLNCLHHSTEPAFIGSYTDDPDH